MRHVWIVLAAMSLVGCMSPPKPTTMTTQCTSPRPQVCTMEYAPVCATRTNGVRAEYSSACNACADDSVSGYLTGPCPPGGS